MSEIDESQRLVAEQLAEAIAQGREHMEKCFACAFEAIQILAISEPDENHEELVPLDGMYEFIEKTFGLELIEEAKSLIQFNLMSSFLQHQALTTCLIWQLGHAIEHATMLSSPTFAGTEVLN